jgi:hypothetical protein
MAMLLVRSQRLKLSVCRCEERMMAPMAMLLISDSAGPRLEKEDLAETSD